MTSQRLSLIWPVLILAIAGVWFAQAFGVLPAPIVDLITRGWPVVLVVVGLMLLLGRRVRFGNVLSIILSAAVVGGVVFTAYRQQGTRAATDNHKAFTQPIDAQVTTLNVVLNTLNTEIAVQVGTDAAPTINADFTGSRASILTSDFKADGPNGTFTINETQNTSLSALEGLGRGKLIVVLPNMATITGMTLNVKGQGGDISLDTPSARLTEVNITSETGATKITTLPSTLTNLSISGQGELSLGILPASLTTITLKTSTGSANFDASATNLKNMTIAANGSVSVVLPDKSGLIGDIKAGTDATVTIPANIAANIRLIGNAANTPSFSQTDYILNIDKVLVSRRSNEPQMQLKIEADGKVVVQ